MVSTKKVCFENVLKDLVRICYLHINKPMQHFCIAAKATCSDVRILTMQTCFCPLLNVHFNDMQIKRWLIKQPLGNFPSMQLVLKKKRPKKVFFYRNKQMNCISCLMIQKMFFYYKFANISAGRENEKKEKKSTCKCKALCVSCKTIIYSCVPFDQIGNIQMKLCNGNT